MTFLVQHVQQIVDAAGVSKVRTAPEAEIVDHLVRGETYAEIARDLVLSEKTVSTHVSNLLRKTGTTSRVELAQLVARVEPA
jgi:DNA-binding NarL/FixJ family response regulator